MLLLLLLRFVLKINFLRAFIFYTTSVVVSYAQLRFQNYSIEHGLSHTIVNDVIQDSTGFLWFATGNGLDKFDGYHFQHFKRNPKSENSISGNRTSKLFIDSKNQLWIGVENGLDRMDLNTQIITQFNNQLPMDQNMLAVMSIEEDQQGNVWFFSEKYKSQRFIFYYSYFDGQFHTVEDSSLNAMLSGSSHFLKNKKGDFFLVGKSYILRKDHQNRFAKAFDASVHLNNHTFIEKAFFDDNDHLWIALEGKLYKLCHGNFTIKATFKAYSQSASQITSIIQIPNSSRFWIGISNDGIYIWDTTGHATTHVMPEKNIPNTLAEKFVNKLLVDKSNVVWVTTLKGGISKYDISQKQFKLINDYTPAPKKINSAHIASIIEDDNENIWFYTANGYLHFWDRKNETITSKFINPHKLRTIPLIYSSFGKDSKGTIWGMLWNYGYFYFTPKKGMKSIDDIAIHIHSMENKTKGMFVGWSPRDIVFDKNDNMWIAFYDSGLEMLERNTGKIHTFKHQPNDSNSLCSYQLWSLYYDKSSDKIWAGSNNNGFSILDISTKKIKNYTYHQWKHKGLSVPSVRCFFKQNDSIFWLGTAGAGLLKFNIYKNEIVNFGISYGLPDNTIYTIFPDDDNNIWLSTEGGLVKFNMLNHTFTNYTEDDGLQSNEFNIKSGYKTRKGEILVGGIKGLNYFYPHEITQNISKPNVAITNVKIYNKTISPNDTLNDRILMQKVAHKTKKITLYHYEYPITLEFSALHYASPKSIQYAYMLKGFDNEKSYVGAEKRLANYTNLPPGKYTFMVYATNNDGVWSENPATLEIEVLPPFWDIWWFKLMLFSFIASIIAGMFYWRVKSITKRNVLLSRLVAERTREIAHKNELLLQNQEDLEAQKNELLAQTDQLQEMNLLLTEKNQSLELAHQEIHTRAQQLAYSNTELEKLNAIKDKFFSIISHDLKNPFQAILTASEFLHFKFDELNTSERKDLIESIFSSSKNIYSLIENLLHWARTQTNSIQPAYKNVSVNELIWENIQLYELYAKEKNIEVNFDKHSVVYAFCDERLTSTVIRNILNNALKFTPKGGLVRINAGIKQNECYITIQDTGPGIPHEFINKMDSGHALMASVGSNGESGTGLGLLICKEFLQINHGKLLIDNLPDAGAVFTIILPQGIAQIDNQDLAPLVSGTHKVENHWFTTVKETETLLMPELPEKVELLIVDDNPSIRKSLQNALKNTYSITLAENGSDAWTKIVESVPDVIISDVSMPDMDGFALCKLVKETPATCHIPVILLTAGAENEKKITGYNVGADDYINKPFQVNVLDARIKNLVSTRKSLKEYYTQLVMPASHTKPLAEIIKQGVNPADEKFLKQARHIIEQNLQEPHLDLDLLCKELGVSRSQLFRKFKALVNETPNDFILKIRLNKAAEMLHQGEYSVQDAMVAVGINSRSYFTTAFSKHFGIKPSEWLKKQPHTP